MSQNGPKTTSLKRHSQKICKSQPKIFFRVQTSMLVDLTHMQLIGVVCVRHVFLIANILVLTLEVPKSCLISIFMPSYSQM